MSEGIRIWKFNSALTAGQNFIKMRNSAIAVGKQFSMICVKPRNPMNVIIKVTAPNNCKPEPFSRNLDKFNVKIPVPMTNAKSM